MIKVIFRGIFTGKELGYSKYFKEVKKVRYRHYLVGSALEVLSLPVESSWTIEGFLEKYYPKDQIKIIEEIQ
jgi:hypothetical protein